MPHRITSRQSPKRKNRIARTPVKIYKKVQYFVPSFEEYTSLRQLSMKMTGMGILEFDWMGDAFKVIASIVLTNPELITDRLLLEYKFRKFNELDEEDDKGLNGDGNNDE